MAIHYSADGKIIGISNELIRFKVLKGRTAYRPWATDDLLKEKLDLMRPVADEIARLSDR